MTTQFKKQTMYHKIKELFEKKFKVTQISRIVDKDPIMGRKCLNMCDEAFDQVLKYSQCRRWSNFSMAGSPRFGDQTLFRQNCIRLADVDGTGTTDIIYLDSSGVRFWKNQAGNSWSQPVTLHHFTNFQPTDTVSVLDLFGNGTSCILAWTPAVNGKPASARYLELTGGKKPFLMTEMDNNMGAITRLVYAPSTKFYIRDKRQGKPWITKLPFPVQVLERTESWDAISSNRFVTRYAYHHGYFDGMEREFRGFGMVEQWDTELYSELPGGNLFQLGQNEVEDSNTPPVYTKTWFHTGFYGDDGVISAGYQSEYFSGDSQAWLLPDTTLPSGLTPGETREACRAMKGNMLRQEIYGLDETASAAVPYQVTEKSFTIRLLQSRSMNPHAVFHTVDSETLLYHYERNASDPRILHTLVLECDTYGNILKSADISYPRRSVPTGLSEQGALLIRYAENSYINTGNSASFYRIGMPFEKKSYQIHNLTITGKSEPATLLASIQGATDIANQTDPGSGIKKRILASEKILYYSEDCSSALTAGSVASHGLPYHTLALALSGECLTKLVACNTEGGVTHNSLLPTAAGMGTLLTSNGYIYDSSIDGYWRKSERITHLASHFFMPWQHIDPTGNTTELGYDSHYLLPVTVTDPLGQVIMAYNDYRHLKPWKITDVNGNHQAVAFSPLGMVTALAMMGKNGEGDTLSDPTTRFTYDLFQWTDHQKPVFVHVETRDTHQSSASGWLHSYTYSNGFAQELQTKIQAEDGDAWHLNNGVRELVSCTDRWVASGRKILNNKALVVKQYEPWFSTTSQYEGEDELSLYGVTPVMQYDPLGRLIRTDFPDETIAKVEFDGWRQENFDRNDTVADSGWYTAMLGGNADQVRAAQLAYQHRNTPQVIDLDTLGRPILITGDCGNSNLFMTRTQQDITGNTLAVTDALNREMTLNIFDMTGQVLYTKNIDSARRWMLYDQTGKPIRLWDNRSNETAFDYDALQRPTHTLVKENGGSTAKKTESLAYGTSSTNNLKGQVEFQYDQSGKISHAAYDFKGNLLSLNQQLCQVYSGTIDWNSNPSLESETFTESFEYDAMNRLTQHTKADTTVEQYGFNKAGLMESIRARIRGAVSWSDFITDINYNEKGQRTDVYYANGSKTRYDYDPNTFRVIRLLTTRNTGSDILQDLNYIYDPEGNIIQQTDNAQQTFYFSNTVVEPTGLYEYDALYRLTRAEGRELTSLGMATDAEFVNNIPVPNSGANAMQRYTQLYTYDALGNIQSMQSQGRWTRNYIYDTATNRLLRHDAGNPVYSYDAHGNMLTMPHLSYMEWDSSDRLMKTVKGNDTTHYRYNLNGRRVRKVTEKTGNIREERIYLGGFEIYRKTISGSLDFERETLKEVYSN